MATIKKAKKAKKQIRQAKKPEQIRPLWLLGPEELLDKHTYSR
jgi:hypothetical protein